MAFSWIRNRSVEIPTVGNVEHGKCFVLIGCGSRNSKRVKSYGRLKKQKRAIDRIVIRFDGIGDRARSSIHAGLCAHNSTLYWKQNDALRELRVIVFESMSNKCVLRVKDCIFTMVSSSSFSAPRCFDHIRQLERRFTLIPNPEKRNIKENVIYVLIFVISNVRWRFKWLLGPQVNSFFKFASISLLRLLLNFYSNLDQFNG